MRAGGFVESTRCFCVATPCIRIIINGLKGCVSSVADWPGWACAPPLMVCVGFGL